MFDNLLDPRHVKSDILKFRKLSLNSLDPHGDKERDLSKLLEVDRPYSNHFFEKCVLVGPKLADL
jgi:hypothetical protein